MDRFSGAAILHRQGSFSPAVSSSLPAIYSQEYHNWIMHLESMLPYFGNINPHRIRARRMLQYEETETLILEGHRENDVATYGDSMLPYFGNINPHRIPARGGVQYEETLILEEGHGENDVETPMEEMIVKNLKMKSCCEVDARDEDGVTKICTVCQDDLRGEENEEEIGVLDCGHEYHGDCIRNWVVKKNVCPLCNAVAVKVG